MDELSTISIPDGEFLEDLPLERKLLYTALLAAIADKASELRYELGDNGWGKALCTVDGVTFETVPIAMADVEEELRSLHRTNNALGKSCTIRFQLAIADKTAEFLASIQPAAVVLYPIDPEQASDEACRIGHQWLEVQKKRQRASVEAGLKDSREGRTISSNEVRKRFGLPT